MRRALLLLVPLLAAGCLEAWPLTGSYACTADETCPAGFACDDGVCCQPGGTPVCTVIPVDNRCPDGSEPTTYYRDDDHDGFGNRNITGRFCAQPLRTPWVTLDTDCDDNDPTVNPLATDGCDGKDNNCHGDRDEGLARTTWYRDQDGDGYGDPAQSVLACGQPVGYVQQAGDCAPEEVARHPGAPELCNNLDDNCNFQVDDAPLADVGDAFPCQTGRPGICADGRFECQFDTAKNEWARVCNSKRAPEVDICDGLDNDCDGPIDEQPDCGGPQSLVNTVGVRYGAQRFFPMAINDLANRCNKDFAPSSIGPVATMWANPNWTFSTGTAASEADFQVWWVEAPPGEYWDLTAPNLSLRLVAQVNNEINPNTGTGGYFGPPSRYRMPVVFLCGEDGSTQFTRYVHKAIGNDLEADYVGSGILQYSEKTLDTVIPVGGSTDGGGDWLIGRGSGFDISRVKRLEVVVWPQAPAANVSTYTLTVSPQAGFVK